MHVDWRSENLAKSVDRDNYGKVGYFPQRQVDEMAYSVVARARAILFPEYSAKYACQRFFGTSDYSVGGLIPNNGRLLEMRVPRIARVTDELFVDGSIYHIISPLLSTRELSELRQSILNENARGQRGIIRRPGIHGQPLRYCVMCARIDSSIGRPQVWRIVHNFPGVNCCDYHACLLVNTEAVLSPHKIHAPGDWIREDAPVPPLACDADLRFASDVRWVYDQKSSVLPGFQRLGLAIRKALLRINRYMDSKGKLSAVNIAHDLKSLSESTVSRLDPTLLRPGSRPVLRERIRYGFSRYSLLACLANLRLVEVFRLAMAEQEPTESDPRTDAQSTIISRTNEARCRLEELVAWNPTATRSEIIAKDAAAAQIVRRNDPAGYESAMPSKRRQGRNSSYDWDARDLEVHASITDAVVRIRPDARSMAQILERCGYSKRLFEKARGRLPWSKLLISSLIASFSSSQDEQTNFPFYNQRFPKTLDHPEK